MQYIYVLNASGKPLMPTTRKGHVRRLLNAGKARIVSHVPYTIQLKYDTEDKVQPLYGGIDPGRTNIGTAVVTETGKVLYRGHLQTRNKEVPKFMSERRQHRMASRRGERQVRKRRAKKNGTQMASGSINRKLPGYEKTVTVKDIINTEARFNNRKRPEKWVTPTVRQLIQTHISMVHQIEKILPVDSWTLEVNKFAFMKMDDGTCFGVDFQNGRMKGFRSAVDFVKYRQHGRCAFCGREIDDIHHLLARHEYGSNLPENLLGVCRYHHEMIHKGELKPNVAGIRKKYGALSVLNQAIPFILEELIQEFGKEHIQTDTGQETQQFRNKHSLPKDHDIDAVCIACLGWSISPDTEEMPECNDIRQFRRHNRQLIHAQRERAYFLPENPKKAVCKNRHKRFEQKCDSLEEFRQKHPRDVGRLLVKPSMRLRNNPVRIMPGAVFVYRGNEYILYGLSNQCARFMCKELPKGYVAASRCRLQKKNSGLVYVR